VKERLSRQISAIKEQGNYRCVRYLRPVSSTRVLYEGRQFLNLCSNSYLSLHAHEEVITAARDAVREYGAGTCASRSVSGSIDIHRSLEEEIAAFKSYPGALIFSSGYLANMGIIATLAQEPDTIFSDGLNHSSIIDAARLSRARKVIYRHRDMADLERRLKRHRGKGEKFIVTESIFSMDGDVAPLGDLCALKEKYGARLVVDEAHATGVFGERGQGLEEHFGLSGRIDVQMGTFGKALGSFGAFVLSGEIVLDYLVNRARTFMYTTALPASALAAARAALKLVRRDGSIREGLWENIRYMRGRLSAAGFDLKESQGPIIPLIVGEDESTTAMQRMLSERGIFLQAIRPPTVPEGTSRLRLTIVRAYTLEEMDEAVEGLCEAGRAAGVI
jgi:glycine C-acetyltransferase